jgi:hypothetical protein
MKGSNFAQIISKKLEGKGAPLIPTALDSIRKKKKREKERDKKC